MDYNLDQTELEQSNPIPEILPVIPMRDTIVFPFTMYPVLIGRETSLKAVNEAMGSHKMVLLLGQKDALIEEPGLEDLQKIGVLGQIAQMMPLPNNMIKVLISGVTSAKVEEINSEKGYTEAKFTPLYDYGPKKPTGKLGALVRKTRQMFERYVLMNQELPEELLAGNENQMFVVQGLYFMAAYLELDMDEKQKMIELKSIEAKYKYLLTLITREIELQTVSTEISERVQDEIQETQRKFFIQEQIRALQDELDEGEYGDPELQKLKSLIEAAGMPEEVKAKATEELDRLRKTPSMSPEYGVSRNYLEWLVSVPWSTTTQDNLEISRVHAQLDKDHFGLEKAKDRILEHIAVLNLVDHLKGQILCFVGPPGVGKTSIAKSIANALGRKMIRISLGGVSDESEIRGHRRTYIGSMPGRIIQGMKKAGTVNPVIILDEIDKVGHDFRGDPSSAILEVLDPEQNNTFSDHYLDVDYDLSKVMFIATANVASSIQPALLDRMEVINLPGYLEHDKVEIARKHLIPKLLKSHGLKKKDVKFEKAAVLHIIRNYTSEAGVRVLEQQLAAVCRKIARKLVEAGKDATKEPFAVTQANVPELLGVEKYRDRLLDKMDKIGSVNGLAWTSTGGAILQIDVAVVQGKSNFKLTGQLGDVMKESAQAALTYIRAKADVYEIDPAFFEKHEIHIHIPEGAIPKDGPSAGMAMTLAMLSQLTHRKVHHNVAMTGEITLRGEVLAIGGLNEKLLAAQRNKIKKVLIPADNEPDLAEIPDKIKQGLQIIGVKTVDEAIGHVLI